MTEPGDKPATHDDDQVEPGWPWSFILLVVAGGVYLVIRFVELFAKLI